MFNWLQLIQFNQVIDNQFIVNIPHLHTPFSWRLTILPRSGDFMAASTIPTRSWRLLGSWANPEAKAASASAWRPRYWRATPCRKYACWRRETKTRVRFVAHVSTHTSADTYFQLFAFFPHEEFREHGTSLHCIPIIEWSVGFCTC